MTKFAKYIGIALLVAALLLLLSANSALAAIANAIRPGWGVWAHIILAALEILAFLWFAGGLFFRDKALIIRRDPSEEDRQGFTRELMRRLRKNPLVSHLDADDPHYLAACMAELNGRADAEIRRTGQRVFLATALSQNGRLDAIIVFFVLCRLVWRISGIYNQRPHPAEIVSLYSAVITSSFLAFSFEELDLSTEVAVSFGEMIHATAPAMATSAVPFVGSALQKFTASVIDGAANCYLTLRAGIITRNAFAFNLEGERMPSRAEVFKEAGAILFSMSGGVLQIVAQTLKERFMRLAKAVQSAATGAAGMAQNLIPGANRASAPIEVSSTAEDAECLSITAEASESLLWRAGKSVGSTAIRTGLAASRPFRPKNVPSKGKPGDPPTE